MWRRQRPPPSNVASPEWMILAEPIQAPLSPMARSNARDFALQLSEKVYRLSNQ